MNRSALLDLIRTDPRAVCCAETCCLIHVDAEVVVCDEDPGARFHGLAAHLASCVRWDRDPHGLFHLLRESVAADESTSRA